MIPSGVKLRSDLKYTLEKKMLPRGQDPVNKITNTCNLPENVVTVDYQGECFLCTCDGYLPIPIGHVMDFNSLDSIWNHPVAKILQQDVKDQKFTWCSTQHCGVKHRNMTVPEHYLSINIDESCNLHCHSCRREKIMITSGPVFDQKREILLRIMQWLENFDRPITITLSGNGDPLASAIIRPLIQTYKPRDNQKFYLFTNGLLMNKILPNASIKSAISKFMISVDAGSEAVYENVRSPGKWNVLIDNLTWMRENYPDTPVLLLFVLQANNWHDLNNFADLCKRFNCSGTVSPLEDWGTWSTQSTLTNDAWTLVNGQFWDHNVLSDKHPNHTDCINMLKFVKLQQYTFLKMSAYFDQFFKNLT